MHPRVLTGLASIVETDDFQPPTTTLDREFEWMYPGLRKQGVASFHAKNLEIATLADRFDTMRAQADPAVPFHQFSRYRPREGVQRQWVNPLSL